MVIQKAETNLTEDIAGDRLVSDAIPAALSVGVILASVREGRQGEALAKWICEQITPRSGMKPELLDLRDWALPSGDRPSFGLGPRWAETIEALDSFVIVTPEYNHSFPGLLKVALDSLNLPWNYKPVTFLSYGYGASGARAVEQLRQIAVELRMVPIRDEVNIRLGDYPLDERGYPVGDSLAKRTRTMLDELLWWARLMKEARKKLPR